MTTHSAEKLAQPHDCGPEKHYHHLLAEGIFALQHCNSCHKAIFYPRMVCPHCGGVELRWEQASGKGTVYSTTVVRRKPEHGGDYNVVLVDLDEGVRLMSRVQDMAPDQVSIGQRVSSLIITENEAPLLVFTPEA